MLVSARSLGSKRPLFADWAVPPPERPGTGDGGLTLRDLISHVVKAELGAFRLRQEARRLDRVLSAREIEDGVARGRVSPEGRGLSQRVDEPEAIAAALQAFADGLYLVVIDGTEHRDLDAQVYLNPDSRITFIRLVFLAGG
jgi:hypothetical protein